MYTLAVAVISFRGLNSKYWIKEARKKWNKKFFSFLEGKERYITSIIPCFCSNHFTSYSTFLDWVLDRIRCCIAFGIMGNNWIFAGKKITPIQGHANMITIIDMPPFSWWQNRPDLVSRYMRDHWFATVLLTIVDAIKVVFSFLRADNTISVCLQSTAGDDCNRKVQLSQLLGVIIFGVQELSLVSIIMINMDIS